MSATRDPDQILHAWLEEGPTALPAPTVRAIEVATRATAQRRPALRLPWRHNPMSFNYKFLGAAAALAVVLVGGAMLLGPRGDQPSVGGSSFSAPPSDTTAPSPIASATLSPLDTATWTAFTSSRYGFSARYPATFEAVPSLFPWRIPNFTGNMFDGFNSAGVVKWLSGASMALPAGMTQEAWLDAYRRDIVEDGSPLEPEACFEPRESWTPVTIDGRAAELRVGCQTLEAYLFVDDRVYLFGAYAYDSAVPPTAELGVPDEFRDLLERWLTTITLDPASAEPTLTPMPSST